MSLNRTRELTLLTGNPNGLYPNRVHSFTIITHAKGNGAAVSVSVGEGDAFVLHSCRFSSRVGTFGWSGGVCGCSHPLALCVLSPLSLLRAVCVFLVPVCLWCSFHSFFRIPSTNAGTRGVGMSEQRTHATLTLNRASSEKCLPQPVSSHEYYSRRGRKGAHIA